VPQKGFDILLKAMAIAEDLGHDLLLAGDGIEHERLKALSAELGLSNSVLFLGRVDHAKAMTLFHGCSFFVLPSLHEPLGIVNLEAMAAGKAVLASDVGGVSEIVAAGVTGLMVPGGDVQKLAEGLRSLSRDASLRHRLGTAGRQRAEEFDWPKIGDQYLLAYEAAMNLTSAILV
jgi:1,4-alpha-glucan branching enzyme